MICKRCGKDVIGAKNCLYCGKNLAEDGETESISTSVKSIICDIDIDLPDPYEAVLNTRSDPQASAAQGASDSAPSVNSAIYREPSRQSPEYFFFKYRQDSKLELCKRILGKTKLLFIAAFVISCVIVLLLAATKNEILPKLFGLDGYNNFASDEELYTVISNCLTLFGAIILFLVLIGDAGNIIGWFSMKAFGKEVTSQGINGFKLLTKDRLSDKKGSDEYYFVSHSLCMVDSPSYAAAEFVRIILQSILSVCQFLAFANMVSYVALTLVPSLSDIDELSVMIYTKEFWLTPQIALFPIAFWGSILINAIVGSIANKKYTAWTNKH